MGVKRPPKSRSRIERETEQSQGFSGGRRQTSTQVALHFHMYAEQSWFSYWQLPGEKGWVLGSFSSNLSEFSLSTQVRWSQTKNTGRKVSSEFSKLKTPGSKKSIPGSLKDHGQLISLGLGKVTNICSVESHGIKVDDIFVVPFVLKSFYMVWIKVTVVSLW